MGDRRDGIKVKTTISWKALKRVEQTFEETIILNVDDQVEKNDIVGKEIKKAIYPQELLSLLSPFKKFEFVSWWNNRECGAALGASGQNSSANCACLGICVAHSSDSGCTKELSKVFKGGGQKVTVLLVP